jgi:peroxiredoxin family protein
MPAQTATPPTAAPATKPAFDPLADAIAAVDGWPEATEVPAAEALAAPAGGLPAKPKELLIIDYSGDLEKVWATLILASTSGAMGVKTRVFVTFWGLQVFVKDEKRITGRNWMQKMLAAMQRPGVSHRKLSKMNFLGMGPWMMGRLAKEYGVASPKDLLEAAQAMGVEFIPCQMTMDMFGLKPEDMIEGMAEPVGAATVIGLLTEDSVPLFI